MRRGQVEEEVRYHPALQEGQAVHLQRAGTQRCDDVPMFGTFELLGLDGLQPLDGARDALLQLGQGLLFVRELRRLEACESRGAVLREVGGQLHLPGEREHVGCDPE